MPSKLFPLFILLSALVSSPVMAADAENAEPVILELKFHPDREDGKYTYEICASCHLPEGWGNQDGTYPQLAGQHRRVLVRQLLDIRSGDRDNPIMYPFVQERTIGGYQSLADVVDYISTLPMTPDHGKGPWKAGSEGYEKGKALFNSNCLSCHGENAEGNNATATPRLQGQHYAYSLRQVDLVTKGIRVVNAAMTAITSRLTREQISLITNYISHLPVAEKDLAPSVDWRNPDFLEVEE